MLVVGPDGLIVHANAAVHRLLGYPVDSLPGASIETLAPPSEHAALMLLRAAGQTAADLQIRSRALRSDGREIDVRMTVKPCTQESERAVDLFVSYQALAPWEAQREDEHASSEHSGSDLLTG